MNTVHKEHLKQQTLSELTPYIQEPCKKSLSPYTDAVPWGLSEQQVRVFLRFMPQECSRAEVDLSIQGGGVGDSAASTSVCSLGEAVARLQEGCFGHEMIPASQSALCFSRPLPMMLSPLSLIGDLAAQKMHFLPTL